MYHQGFIAIKDEQRTSIAAMVAAYEKENGKIKTQPIRTDDTIPKFRITSEGAPKPEPKPTHKLVAQKNAKMAAIKALIEQKLNARQIAEQTGFSRKYIIDLSRDNNLGVAYK